MDPRVRVLTESMDYGHRSCEEIVDSQRNGEVLHRTHLKQFDEFLHKRDHPHQPALSHPPNKKETNLRATVKVDGETQKREKGLNLSEYFISVVMISPSPWQL